LGTFNFRPFCVPLLVLNPVFDSYRLPTWNLTAGPLLCPKPRPGGLSTAQLRVRAHIHLWRVLVAPSKPPRRNFTKSPSQDTAPLQPDRLDSRPVRRGSCHAHERPVPSLKNCFAVPRSDTPDASILPRHGRRLKRPPFVRLPSAVAPLNMCSHCAAFRG
jgi:hypothetical protein